MRHPLRKKAVAKMFTKEKKIVYDGGKLGCCGMVPLKSWVWFRMLPVKVFSWSSWGLLFVLRVCSIVPTARFTTTQASTTAAVIKSKEATAVSKVFFSLINYSEKKLYNSLFFNPAYSNFENMSKMVTITSIQTVRNALLHISN
jgi:hypothetical protein